jgi:uncharacterized membrane protein
MDALTVWRFEGTHVAEELVSRLEPLVREGHIRVEDAALASWPEGHRKPSTRVLGGLTGPGALWGGFWGLLLGLIFLTPLAGPTFGAAAGAFAGSLADFGVDDDFVKRVRDTVTPGSSALFVISDSESVDRIAATVADRAVDMIRSDLSSGQAQHLRDTLGEEAYRH